MPMSKQVIAVACSALAIAAAAAGCGGSDDESLTKAELIRQGDAICKQGGETIQAELAGYVKDHEIGPTSRLTKENQEEVVLTIILPTLQAEAEELGELEAPEAEADEFTAIVEGLEGAVEKGEAAPLSMLNSAPKPLAEAGELAGAYGFEDCAQV